MTEFTGFPKMARLSRECVITEKIDGTNACVCITEEGEFLVGKRTGWITPENDNFGFAKWAYEHKEELMQLGPGKHFGEWFGAGIQIRYGLTEKRFALFNTLRWHLYGSEPKRIVTADPRIEKYTEVLPACCGLVPVLYRGIFDTGEVDKAIEFLKVNGSQAVPGFMKPEGIVVFHTAAGIGFKKTIENDEKPKGKN